MSQWVSLFIDCHLFCLFIRQFVDLFGNLKLGTCVDFLSFWESVPASKHNVPSVTSIPRVPFWQGVCRASCVDSFFLLLLPVGSYTEERRKLDWQRLASESCSMAHICMEHEGRWADERGSLFEQVARLGYAYG